MLSSQLAEPLDHSDADETGGAPAGADRLTVTTRFGRIEIDAANVITLSRPLHGFPGLKRFALLDVPGAEAGNFKLFQAVDNPAIGFIVLPMSKQANVIAPGDLAQACSEHGLDVETAAVLLLVTFRQDDAGARQVTVNLRAPLLLDVAGRTARQHIFVNADYPVRLPLEAAQ
jgi:flagellar assembly factor FliW